MSLYGFTGFPLRDSLPRGFSFVYFMRLRYPKAPPQAPLPPAPSAPARPASGGVTPGGFADGATETTVSSRQTPEADGVMRTDAEKRFSDGSRRSEVHRKHPDGTFEIETERRSTPDEEGFEKVRIWSQATAPDGSESATFRVFRVPTGETMDWNGADAREFLVTSVAEAPEPDGAPAADMATPPAGPRADSSESAGRDTTAAKSRPVIPLAP